jgi:hypothetical protein
MKKWCCPNCHSQLELNQFDPYGSLDSAPHGTAMMWAGACTNEFCNAFFLMPPGLAVFIEPELVPKPPLTTENEG